MKEIEKNKPRAVLIDREIRRMKILRTHILLENDDPENLDISLLWEQIRKNIVETSLLCCAYNAGLCVMCLTIEAEHKVSVYIRLLDGRRKR